MFLVLANSWQRNYEEKLLGCLVFVVNHVILSTAAEPLVKSIRLHGNAVMCLAADDKYIISGSKDCTVAVYDRRAGKGLKKLQVAANIQTHM